MRREFDAEITEQVPDELIAWASVDGTSHSGSRAVRAGQRAITNVSLEMLWLPETVVEKVGAALNIDERQAQMDLERFKSFIEERGRETGGWRGEVHDGVPAPESGMPSTRWPTTRGRVTRWRPTAPRRARRCRTKTCRRRRIACELTPSPDQRMPRRP